ncbi:putative manganese-dependent inorganic diphosphatase [Methanofollis fontis]|uniref:inorganic diphosphatase n=1 Tax=Methanofollis fontis TaxID=2052832 RepID=A0A483CQQ3_9EURY|nr:putative manganese-dependent inorganic diphosphatase [Methanofollis fontis]TAJ45025.1 pyrophosphatase [Methanofollis fontis]
MNKVYVIGHKHPDTDSICSAIGYAELLNHGEDDRYVAARCGEINPETRFALERFRVEAPLFIESVEPNVSDLPFTYPISAGVDRPTIEVVALMDEHGVRNMPIVDDEGRLLGLVSEHGLARAYVTRTRIQQLSITPIKLETLAKILDAEILVPGMDLLEGRVYIAIDALHVSLTRLTSSDVAIVGDNEPAQLALISAGIAALIIADASPVGERVINAARAQNVAVLATALDAFGVGKMINLSLPSSMVMATDVPRIGMSDPLEYVKDVVTNSKYRTACVVDGDNRLLGMVSRNTFVDDVQKSVILVDHNEFSQAVDGIETADVREIIDHHRLGAITTLRPIRFLNDPVGSTSTIVTRKFIESGIEPAPATAGLLLAGILSDTLALKMSTTTPEDERAVEYLAGIAGVDAAEFGIELVRHGIDLESVPLRELLMRDTKHYELFGRKVVIAQVTVPSFAFSEERADEIRELVTDLRQETGADFFVALFTNVFENGSDLFAAADEVNLAKCEMNTQPLRLPGVMSRKKDFLPHFGNMLRNL